MKNSSGLKKLAGPWLGYLTLVALSACVQKEDPAGPEIEPATVGQAEIFLPALPAEFLVKRSSGAVKTVSAKEAMFILTLSGPDMVARKQAWPLGPNASGPIRVANIPVGNRQFIGELDVDGTITHAGNAWTVIQAGKTAQVHLKLAAIAGNADICVEIEGLPLPAGCQPKPPIPYLTGCWYFTVPNHPDLGTATMRLNQKGSAVTGEVRWANGRVDSAIGSLDDQGILKMGYGPTPNDWMFLARYDGINFTLNGTFLRRTGEPYRLVNIMAFRTECKIVEIPIEDPIIPVPEGIMACFEVAQGLDSGATSGRLSLLERNDQLFGFFLWDGYTAMPVNGKSAYVNGNKGLYLYGNLPFGLARPSLEQVDRVHYKGQVPPEGGPILYGTIYGVNPSGEAVLPQRGVWKGSSIACNPKDADFIRSMHKL